MLFIFDTLSLFRKNIITYILIHYEVTAPIEAKLLLKIFILHDEELVIS